MKADSLIVLSMLIALLGAAPLHGQALAVEAGDLRIEQRGDGGYHLYIRAKPGIGSVLLTETTKDPAGKSDNYAYRAEAWNAVNGDEKRLLNGAFIPASSKVYSLVDSTPEADAAFGSAFHIFIPWVVAYGYDWSRSGRVFIADGAFVNVRTFAKPYADYSGGFMDNPYEISVTQRSFRVEPPAPLVKEPEPPAVRLPAVEPPAPLAKEPDLSAYMPETLSSFEAIAKAGKGEVAYSEGEEDIVAALSRILDTVEGDELDLVICLDTTDSMSDDIESIKTTLPAMVKEKTARFASFRLGLVLYKDYFEDYVVKRSEFSKDVASFTAAVAKVRVMGGRDIPEAVYEALYEALIGYDWAAKAKLIVLIGDAPPHPLPRGKIDKAMVEEKAAALGVEMSVIILPH